MTDQKKEAARSAVTFITNNSTIGLGCGSTIQYMVNFLSEEIKNGLKLQLTTSSFTTHQLLLQKGLIVQPIFNFETIDIYFDGCDQFDKNLNALKSGGGIHTREKMLASMANEFFLVGDETKYADSLDTKFPLVVEILPEALRYAPAYLLKLFSAVKIAIRVSDKNDGPVITANGNYLLDVWFTAWPDLKKLNESVKKITGVVETSLFCNLANKAIIATRDKIKIVEKAVYY
ncbi:MAG: ribose 5-phosphate isomerase A [Bacteroidota bacterium]